MLAILPADKARVDEWSAQEQDVFDRAMVMTERGAELGHLLYSVAGDTVRIGNIVCDEPLLADGLLRAVLAAAQNAGAKRAVYDGKTDCDFLKKYGFFEQGDVLAAFLSSFFGKCNGDCAHCGQSCGG